MAQKAKIAKPVPAAIDMKLLEKFRRVKLKPSLRVYAHCEGTWVYVEAAWTSFLAGGSLKVVIDGRDDITSKLTVDEAAMKATGTVDVGGVGLHLVEASGEFLASLLPLRTVVLNASSGAYCAY